MTLDESFFLLCNGHHTPLMDQLMLSYTSPFTWIPFYVACFAALIYKFGWAKATFMLIVILGAVGLSDWFCASVLRPVLHHTIKKILHYIDSMGIAGMLFSNVCWSALSVGLIVGRSDRIDHRHRHGESRIVLWTQNPPISSKQGI